jgi:hypothetical protein
VTATLINVPVFWVKRQCRFIYIGTGFSDDFYLEEAGYKIIETLVAILEFTRHHFVEEWNVLGVWAKLGLSTIYFVMSVRPRGITRHPREPFP